MAILMEERYWRNSHLSIARFYGGIQVKGAYGKTHQMNIVNKDEITLMELSNPSSKHYVGDGMAIKPGEPTDLVDVDYIRYYKSLGRDAFIGILTSHNNASRKRLHELYKEAVRNR